MPTARSVYDVRVFDPEPGESSRATGVAWLLAIGATLLGDVPDGSGPAMRVKVAIFAADLDDPVKDWIEEPADARLLKAKIDSDLDQMDAETFAVEWGLPTPTDSN